MISLLLAVGLTSTGLSNSNAHDFHWGAVNGAEARINFQVIDTDGVPVRDAKVGILYTIDHPKVKKWNEKFLTDANGRFVASGKLNRSIGIDVSKEGFYTSFVKIDLPKTQADPAVINNRWQPYDEQRTIVLKKVKDPIEMSGVKRFTEQKIPAFDEWIPYDLEKAQWLTPYGNGECNDVLLRFHCEGGADGVLSTMELSFTNLLHAGCYIAEKDKFSELQNNYSADANHDYKKYIKFSIDTRVVPCSDKTRLNSDEYLVFRTRTSVDGNGNLIKAHYGTIIGDLEFGRKLRLSSTSFNPTPNDTNLEDMETYRRSLQRRNR